MTYEVRQPQEIAHESWEPAVSALLRTVGKPGFSKRLAKGIMGNLCLVLIENGSLRGFGEMQAYLACIGADIQLFPSLLRPDQKLAGDHAVDPISGEPQDYYLRICVGLSEIMTEQAILDRTAEETEVLLAERTGVLMHGGQPAEASYL